MNTIQVLKKCIQIDFSEYTLFLNTLVKFEFIDECLDEFTSFSCYAKSQIL